MKRTGLPAILRRHAGAAEKQKACKAFQEQHVDVRPERHKQLKKQLEQRGYAIAATGQPADAKLVTSDAGVVRAPAASGGSAAGGGRPCWT
jgi:hypothetical protein